MADGTISIAEGLGIKALDSNEVRRKQMNLVGSGSPLHIPISQTDKSNNSNPFEFETPRMGNSGGTVPPSCSAEFGEFSPKSAKCPSPSRKLQQVFEQELIREAESQNNRGQENKFRNSSEVELKGSAPPSTSSSGTALLHNNANQ
ncbi:hypothetical protein RHGRI_010972 [Rhododendron griersonianum]|uniref:Uncharacterized protein n=1 Tax=Rhododendron griersonianum TaxID=479676 RepID=A0AAV6KK64_9ERIC|nr:hypothetical protein RHGRI_010972 [Rhododendron griersonianum]